MGLTSTYCTNLIGWCQEHECILGIYIFAFVSSDRNSIEDLSQNVEDRREVEKMNFDHLVKFILKPDFKYVSFRDVCL